jgi:diamine N-acetyltransferase
MVRRGLLFTKASMQSVLSILSTDKEHDKVFLSLEPENKAAREFYEKLGFTPDGRVIEDEVVYCMRYTS